MGGVRVDKWLWAARFFKTRAKAKEAIDGGKVHLDGHRVKPSKELQLGQELVIRQGWDEKTVVIMSPVRATPRCHHRCQPVMRKPQRASPNANSSRSSDRPPALSNPPAGRPTKKDRRLIHQFRENNTD